MTDMTVSFLFIVMILLAFFATQIAPEDAVSREEYSSVLNELRERDEELSERDAQISSLLQQLTLFRERGNDLIPWLQAENARLISQASELESQIARLEIVLDLRPGEDAVTKIAQLRKEIDLLHRLLEQTRESNPIERYNTRVTEFRGRLLRTIQARINDLDAGIEVTLSRNLEALQFKGDGLFASGRDVPSRPGRAKMEQIAKILNEELSCYALGAKSNIAQSCNPAVALISSLQVEGHTDGDGTIIFNMGLSSRRSAAVFSIMAEKQPGLLEHKNLRSQPVLSVAGYGEGRPIADDRVDGGKDANRRIDLRLIMFSPADEQSIPQGIEDIERLRQIYGGDVAR